MLERIIFAIDNDTKTYNVMQFLKFVSQEQALGRMSEMKHLVGCYSGNLENSYMILAKDLSRVFRFIEGQESILRVPGDVRQPCVLEYVANGKRESIGPMVQVEPLEALESMAWTFDLESGKYFICKGA